jgi:hypothetical protein
MKQYEFRLTSKINGSNALFCATAKSAKIARNQIAKAFSGSHTVSEHSVNEYPPHYFYTEMDCSTCDIDDVEEAA